MKTSCLALACIFMTLGLTLGLNYGYGYTPYVPYVAPQSNPLGIGQGGLLVLFGIFFIFILLLNSSIFSQNNTPDIVLIG